MNVKKFARLTGDKPLSDAAEEEVRQIVIRLGILAYRRGRDDVLREITELVM